MKLLYTLVTLFSLAIFSSAQYTNQTGPFKLQLVSTDAKYNGQYLSTCHEGAAIESLCPLGSTGGVDFFFNYTGEAATQWTSGYLTWILVGGNFEVSSALTLSYDPVSNVAVPLFFPGADRAQLLSFNADGFMNIMGSDPTIVPRNFGANVPYFRFFICNTYVGYQMDTVAWSLGSGQPDNPTCVSVQIQQIWAS
jgi:hypothetical protein